MNNDKRIFALVSLGLFLIAFLAPFIIATSGRDELAVGFGLVAGLLAVLFGALSWNDRIGRTVTTALLPIFVVAIARSAIIYSIRQGKSGESDARTATEAPAEIQR